MLFNSVNSAALVCVVGCLVYSVAVPPKIAEVGRLMFWVGLLVFLFKL